MSDPIDLLTERIIGCVIEVHRALGPGFLEIIYHRALAIELHHNGLMVDCEREVRIWYRGREVGRHRLDMLVEDTVVVELKTVESLGRAHYAQLRSYLRATGLATGLLVNFSADKADFRRMQVVGS
jgi:GxxExxY protein